MLTMQIASGCNLTTTPVTPAISQPTIQFLAPAPGAQVTEGQDVTITLLAQDAVGTGIARVVLLIDDLPHQEAVPVVSAAVPIFTVEMNWLAAGVGAHALTAIPYRLDGSQGTPAVLRVVVQPASGLPAPTLIPAQVG